jgi:beta-glucanase (GH16 family)
MRISKTDHFTRRDKHPTFVIPAVLMASFVLCGAQLPGQPAGPVPLLEEEGKNWKLVWSDEFDYPDADLEKNWESQNGPSGHILSSRWRENVLVNDGTLKLINRKEKRGGQEWTSGNIWSKEHFQYGYFECRYRYAAAYGTNNSFWLMTRGADPTEGKRFEIDINEGHFPNEINTNIHNWTDVTVVNGRRIHPSSSKSFNFGVRPDCRIQLEIPVTTRRLRFVSDNPSHFHLCEFRIYNVNPAGYPEALSETADTDVPGLVNYARDPATRITASGVYQSQQRFSPDKAADGTISDRWVSQAEGPKWIEFELAREEIIGCVQFVNGWKHKGNWTGMVSDYRVQYYDGDRWVDIASFDIRSGDVNFARDFHVYGLKWTKEELVFYFDGKPIRREKNEFCHSPAPVWLSLAIIPWAGNVTDAIDGTQMEVDYVRIYKCQ